MNKLFNIFLVMHIVKISVEYTAFCHIVSDVETILTYCHLCKFISDGPVHFIKGFLKVNFVLSASLQYSQPHNLIQTYETLFLVIIYFSVLQRFCFSKKKKKISSGFSDYNAFL